MKKNKEKIAFISFYSGIVERGVETFAHETAKRMTKDFDVTIYQSRPVKEIRKEYLVQVINTLSKIPSSSKQLFGKIYLDYQSFKILHFTIKILPKLLKGNYKLIVPLNGGWQIVLIRIFCFFKKIKLLVSGHAGIGSDDAWNLFFRPDVFVALTSAQLTWAKRLAPEVKIVLIPNGVDLAKFNPKVKPQAVPLKGKIVICASALDQYKRVDLTIKAVAKTNLSLLVLGDGQLRGQIDNLGKRLLGQRYLRLAVPHSQMPNYYRAGHVFTLASETEAFGISYIEAMACNLPVVATADASREEIIGRAGILTNPENIDKYAKDLQIAANTNYRSIPYDQSLKFSWNIIAQKYIKLIDKLISEK